MEIEDSLLNKENKFVMTCMANSTEEQLERPKNIVIIFNNPQIFLTIKPLLCSNSSSNFNVIASSTQLDLWIHTVMVNPYFLKLTA